ncbi:hypothetical protein AB833_22040 [Chromatiales bacterium (ex Bugula neritina AB1)]|nr:hypothetical protein AB833_22040 [Chromatiales bacterium (ex Bugula neritina AB1)]
MPQLPIKNYVLTLICLVAVALGAITALTNNRVPQKPQISGFAFPNPKALYNVNLIDQYSKPLTEHTFNNIWTFIYVGYTFCPDACPLALTTMNQILGILEKQQQAKNVQMLLVSVDPQRDTPERLLEYTKYFNKDFLAATGTAENIKSFAKQVSAVYSLPEDRSDPNYLVDHSSSMILINPEKQVHAIFTPPQKATAIAEDYINLSAQYNSIK